VLGENDALKRGIIADDGMSRSREVQSKRELGAAEVVKFEAEERE